MGRPAGRRDKLIGLERASTEADDYGEDRETWAALTTRYAEVWMGKGSERREAAAERGRQAATFGVADDSVTRTLTLRDRVTYAGSAWDIESIAPDTPERGWIEITAVREA
ncbi:head-tail adaptor protein [Aurantiacibacter luteus]|uniref:Phage head-tail adapter protein n=1 Tax=Aurantiacibacter luteus TaxID=1581420 RepID=A0A0G9MPC6_9SPHN|nr:head-tail adaptor protein [Aurantiacibacter luteus]KLE32454.1 hypothetical protein AAW00_13585 [Aurantiacibacter luteus]